MLVMEITTLDDHSDAFQINAERSYILTIILY